MYFDKSQQKGNIFIYLVIGILIILGIIGGIYYFYGQQATTPVNSLATPPRT